MTWLVLTIIFGIIGGIATIVAVESKDKPDGEMSDGRAGGVVIAGLCGLGFLLATLVSSIYIIGAGHIGVVYGFGGGKIVGRLENGTHLIAPWREVRDASVQTQRTEFDYLGDQAAVSKESQAIYAVLFVNYHLADERVYRDEAGKIVRRVPGGPIWLYTHVGPDWFSKLMEGRAAQDFKEVSSEYSTPNVVPNREQIRVRTLARMRRELGPYSVSVDDVQLKNLHFTERYTDSITDKQVAAQQALAALSRAQALRNQAAGEADAVLIRAKRQADANLRIARSITPELIQWHYVQKLAGARLIVTSPGSSLLLPSGFLTAPEAAPKAGH